MKIKIAGLFRQKIIHFTQKKRFNLGAYFQEGLLSDLGSTTSSPNINRKVIKDPMYEPKED